MFWILPMSFQLDPAGAFAGAKETTLAALPHIAEIAADITASSTPSSSAEGAATAFAAGADGADGADGALAGAFLHASIALQTCFIPIIMNMRPIMTMNTMLNAISDITSPPPTPVKWAATAL